MKVSEAVRSLRMHLEMKTTEFGRVVGVSRIAIHSWEHDKYPPSEQHAFVLFGLSKRSKAPDAVVKALEALTESEARP